MLSEAPTATLIDRQIIAAVETGDVQALIDGMLETRLTEKVEELVGLMKKSGVTDDQYVLGENPFPILACLIFSQDKNMSCPKMTPFEYLLTPPSPQDRGR